MAHEVFISYASAEAAEAEDVCSALEAVGIACWMAPRDIKPGSEYAEQLVEAIRSARVLVLVFSAAANASEHVRRELDRAISAGLAILPLRIEDLEPTGALDYYLAGRQWCDALGRPLMPHLEKLPAAVKDLLESKEQAPPAVRRPRRKRGTTILLSVLGLALVVAVAALTVWALTRSKAPTTAASHGSHTTGLAAAQIAHKYGPSVVLITANVPSGVDGKLTWKKIVGSGCVISKNGTIITSSAVDYCSSRGPMVAPVVNQYWEQWVTVEFWGSQGQYSKVRGFVFGLNWASSARAMIVVDPHKVHLVPIPLGDSDAARVGEPLVALTRADLGLTSAPEHLSAVWHSSAYGGSGNKTVWAMCTDVDLGDAALGAPLIDASGHVIATIGPVPCWAYNDPDGDHASSTAGSAMAINGVQDDIGSYSQLYSGRTTWLDLHGQTVTPGVAKTLGLPAPSGVLVDLVDPGGPAARAGIRGGTALKTVPVPDTGQEQFITGGDLIVAIDGKPASSWDTYYQILDKHKPGDIVTVRLYRGRTLLTVKAKLTAFPYTPPTA